jgi:hypothetical protein
MWSRAFDSLPDAASIAPFMLRPGPVGGERPGAPSRWHPLLLVPLALSAWVYYPITRVNFFADDFAHLASIESDGVLPFLLSPFGGHNYLVRNLLFLGSWELFGLHASDYFVTVLLTHLLNVGLLFGVLRTFTRSPALACFGAALWGTSPLCVGTLAWYSVYGHVLVATILLFVLGQLARLAASGVPPRTRTATLWYALLLAGTTCFGVGIGVALAFPFVLFLLLPRAWSFPRLRVAWLLLPAVTLALYFAFRRLYPLLAPLTFQENMQEYIALHGLAYVPPMLAHLLGFSIAGTTLGLLMRQQYPSPACWMAIAAYVCGLGLLFWRGDATTRRTALAMLGLAVSIYVLIAAGRSSTYAMFSISAAAAARVARYHYVGSLPIVIVLCLILRELGRLPGLGAVPAPLALAAGLGTIVFGAAHYGISFQEYRATPQYLQQTAAAIAAEIRAQPPGSTVYLENGRAPGYILGPAIPGFLFPGRAGVYVLFNRSDQFEGRTVRFVERDTEVAQYYAQRPHTRLARLLVGPGDVTSHP